MLSTMCIALINTVQILHHKKGKRHSENFFKYSFKYGFLYVHSKDIKRLFILSPKSRVTASIMLPNQKIDFDELTL